MKGFFVIGALVGGLCLVGATAESGENWAEGGFGPNGPGSCGTGLVDMGQLVLRPQNEAERAWCVATDTGVMIRFGVEMGQPEQGAVVAFGVESESRVRVAWESDK